MRLQRLTLLLPAPQGDPGIPVQASDGIEPTTARQAIPWQLGLLRCLGIDQSVTAFSLPVGTALAFEPNRIDSAEHPVLRADPVCMVPNRDRAVLIPTESLALQDAEVSALADDLNRFLAEDGLTLHVAHPHRWYLIGEGLCSMHQLPPEQLAFTDVGVDTDDQEEPPPSSELVAARRRLRGLVSEIEMFLYTHPVNEARRERSQPAVSGLYLWGATHSQSHGVEPVVNASASEHAAIAGVVGDDPWVRSAASVAQVPVIAATGFDGLRESLAAIDDATTGVVVVAQEERTHWLASDAERAANAREQFAIAWIQAAQAALRSGELQEIHYHFDDGSHSLETAPNGGVWSRLIKRLLPR